jgi:hypothetical protein
LGGIQVCSNEGESPSSRGDNSKRVRLHCNLKKMFSRTSQPKAIKLGTNYRCVREFKFVQIKGQVIFKGEIIMR